MMRVSLVLAVLVVVCVTRGTCACGDGSGCPTEITQKELKNIKKFDPSVVSCSKPKCDQCTDKDCFCQHGSTGKDCLTDQAAACKQCPLSEACPRGSSVCVACNPSCVNGKCMSKTDGTIGCRCEDGWTGDACDVKSTTVVTYSRWKGFCARCGGCGVQRRKIYINGLFEDREFRRCEPKTCPKRKRGRKMTGLDRNGEKIKHDEPYCCYKYTNPEKPVKTGNPFTGRPCSNRGVQGFA